MVETLMVLPVGAEAAELHGWINLSELRRARRGPSWAGQQKTKYSVQIELAVGDVSGVRVAVRFEIGRPRLREPSLAFPSVRWPGLAGLAGPTCCTGG